MTDSLPTPEEQREFNRSRHQDCPKCGEDNPIEAVMCWACYAPLGTQAEAALEQRQAHERAFRFENRLEEFFGALPFGGIALLVTSGYVRKVRLPLIGAGLLLLASSFAWSKRNEARARIQAEEGRPIERITDTILLYAVRDGASEIRLRAGVGIQLHYFIDDDWKEQMRIPGYVWNDLRAHLQEKSDNFERPVVFEMDNKRAEFLVHFESAFPLETLLLSLKK